VIRVGAIGCGEHATTALWPLFGPAGLQCVAAWSRSEERVDDAAGRFGIERRYTDLGRMFDECELDAVVVVVPPEGFVPVIHAALERGLHVFAEKPGAESAAEARSIADAAEAAGVVAMVAYMKRFGTAFARARGLIGETDFGGLTIGSFKWAMGSVVGEHDSLESWLFENPIHHIDLARYYCGELDSWQAQLARNSDQDFAVSVTARAEGGGVVSMQLSTTGSWEQHNERVELQGQGKSVVVDNVDTCISRTGSQPDLVWRPNYTIPSEENSSAATCGFLGELQAFAGAVQSGKTPPSDFRSAAGTLEAVQQLLESIQR
jgi:predicted dehydrogenase